MKIALIKKDNAYFPYYDSDREAFRKHKNNVVYLAEIKQPRNLKHHKKYWALCTLVYENSEGFTGTENVSDWLKLKVGDVDYIEVTEERTCVKPRSINFESMDQEEFSKFWDRVLPFVCERLGCTNQEINENLIFFM